MVRSKIIVYHVGAAKVGKTSILTQFAESTFLEDGSTTIGVDFKSKHVKLEGKRVFFQVCVKITINNLVVGYSRFLPIFIRLTLLGQERFASIVHSYTRGAHCIVFVYDITNPDSLYGNIPRHIEAFTELDKITTILLGNKNDLQQDRQVEFQEGKRFAEKHNIDLFLETSAKTSDNIVEAFCETAKLLLKKAELEEKEESSSGVVLSAPDKKKKCSGCKKNDNQ